MQSDAKPGMIYHPVTELATAVRGDDLCSFEPDDALDWLAKRFGSAYSYNHQGPTGPAEKDAKGMRLLNRILDCRRPVLVC